MCIRDRRFIKEATADKDRFLEYRNPQGQIMYSAYTALPNGWIIVAAASKEAMLAGVCLLYTSTQLLSLALNDFPG